MDFFENDQILGSIAQNFDFSTIWLRRFSTYSSSLTNLISIFFGCFRLFSFGSERGFRKSHTGFGTSHTIEPTDSGARHRASNLPTTFIHFNLFCACTPMYRTFRPSRFLLCILQQLVTMKHVCKKLWTLDDFLNLILAVRTKKCFFRKPAFNLHISI